MTPDIIDLHGSNQVSGWNRVRGNSLSDDAELVDPTGHYRGRAAVAEGIAGFQHTASRVRG